MPIQNSESSRIKSMLGDLERQPRSPFLKIEAPAKHGVYLIRGDDGTVLHVGRTVTAHNGLAQRLRNHLYGKSSFVRNHLNGETETLRRSFTFQCIVVENDRERALLEHYAIAWFCPVHLGLGRVRGE